MDKKTHLTKFQKSLILQVATSIVIIIIFSAFFYLFRANIKHQVGIVEKFRAQKTKLSNSSQNLSLLIQDWSKIEQYKDRLNELVPIKDDLIGLPKTMETLAKAKNVSISFSFGQEQKKKDGYEIGRASCRERV